MPKNHFSLDESSRHTKLQVGDIEKNYAGGMSPKSSLSNHIGELQDDETPEKILISKERWAIVAHVIQENPEVCENLSLILDHFSGYSWAELGERHNVSRDVARGRVLKSIEYLKKRIKGHQF